MSSLIGDENLSKGARKKRWIPEPWRNQLSQPRLAPLAPTPTTGGISQPASQPASAAAGGISQPCPTPQPSANNRRNQSASQPATQPASAAAGGISQPTPTTGGISQPASQRGGRRNQPVMPQTTCRSRRPAESATSPSGGRRNQPKLPAGGRRNQPETCPAAGGKQLRPQDAPPLNKSFISDSLFIHHY